MTAHYQHILHKADTIVKNKIDELRGTKCGANTTEKQKAEILISAN